MHELDMHEQDTAERVVVEEKAREKKVLQLNVSLKHEITMRNKGDEKFQVEIFMAVVLLCQVNHRVDMRVLGRTLLRRTLIL